MKTKLFYAIPLATLGLFACNNTTENEQPIKNIIEESAALTPLQ